MLFYLNIKLNYLYKESPIRFHSLFIVSNSQKYNYWRGTSSSVADNLSTD